MMLLSYIRLFHFFFRQLALVSKITRLRVKFPTKSVEWSTTKALKCGPTVEMAMLNAPAAVFVASEVNAADFDVRNCIRKVVS